MIILATIRTTGAEGIVTLQEVGSEYSSIGLIPLSHTRFLFSVSKPIRRENFDIIWRTQMIYLPLVVIVILINIIFKRVKIK